MHTPASKSATVRAAIVGASGYSGEELVRLLLQHPRVELAAVTSRQNAGQTVAQVFPRFASQPRARSLRFVEPNADLLARQADVVFLALPHGVAAGFAVPLLAAGAVVIDLSADFRLRSAAVYEEFYGHPHPAPDLLASAVCGLPEAHRERIREASLIASPGCYPTGILLPVLPLLRSRLVKSTGIIADSLSGVSGAGRKVEADFLFCECNESVRAYGVPRHRHLSEIEQELALASGEPVTVQFTPHLIPVNRGILTTLYLAPARHFKTAPELAGLNDEIAACYRAAYGEEPFVRVLEGAALPDTKNVTGTNVLELAWRLDPRTGRLIVLSAEDNIVKGASGQAVQSLNIRFGFPETAGLLLTGRWIDMTAATAFQLISGSGDDLRQVIATCESAGDYCLIGGLAVNCYVEPVYTMDADLVVAAGRLPVLRGRLERLGFEVEDHPHSLNALRPGSELRIRFTKDPRYDGFPARAGLCETLGLTLRVAALADLVQAKIWAWSEPQGRLSKRKMDELDLIRLAESHPEIIPNLPLPIRAQLPG